jgi:hypothetical protein
MSPEQLHAKALAALVLQRELEAHELRFALAIKELMRSESALMVSVDGEIWRLERRDQAGEALQEARTHGGFYSQFRFRNLGKPIT